MIGSKTIPFKLMKWANGERWSKTIPSEWSGWRGEKASSEERRATRDHRVSKPWERHVYFSTHREKRKALSFFFFFSCLYILQLNHKERTNSVFLGGLRSLTPNKNIITKCQIGELVVPQVRLLSTTLVGCETLADAKLIYLTSCPAYFCTT